MDNQKPEQKNQGFSVDEQQAGFVMGAVVGALVGGAAALLLSPKSGKEMRELVKKYSKDLELEAHELAKDARGTADSFKAVLADGANEVIEQAPEKIEQAGYQAQQLADELSNRFNSARDVVTELAEAFRSGWEEYGEDQPIDELAAAPALLADDEGEKNVSVSENQAVDNKVGHASQIEPQSEPSVNTKPDLEPIIPSMASRRRSQPTAYSMHIANEQPATHAEEKSRSQA